MRLTKKQLYKLHQSLAKGEYKDVFVDIIWTHSEIISDLASTIADKLISEDIYINKSLLTQGALIHDIGAYSCFDEDLNINTTPYICHGIIGMDICKDHSIPNRISRFCAYHIGVGITKEDIIKSNLPLPQRDYIPISLEEELIAYSDNFHSKYPHFVSFNDARENIAKFGEDKLVIFDRYKDKFGIPDINKLEDRYKNWHKKIERFYISIRN